MQGPFNHSLKSDLLLVSNSFCRGYPDCLVRIASRRRFGSCEGYPAWSDGPDLPESGVRIAAPEIERLG